ncbi:MAG: hypothetical protein PHI98_03310 [Eubacteriales bacterium]|nr:hypothetical protein [Eubacteriales bacterium]
MNPMTFSFAKRSGLTRWLVALFFVLTLILGFLTVPDYGSPWDENDETDILRMNLWEYTLRLGLDDSLFEKWTARESETISTLTPISQSIEQDHGVSAFYPLAGVVLDTAITEHSRTLLWHLYCWALFTLGLFALYACGRQLELPRWICLCGSLFLLLSPRFFAEGHYNNKDIVLLSLSLCVLWQGLRLMKKPTFCRALLFALVGAFAANTKVVGLALWLLCALFVLIRQIIRRNLNRRVLTIGVTTLVCFCFFYALLTPALWQNPAAFLSYLVENALSFTRWRNFLLFRNTVFDLTTDQLPWYYLPYMIIATTPLWVLFLVGLGLVLFVCRLCKNSKAGPIGDSTLGMLLTTLLWLLPLCFAILTRTTVYNGWRHFYFLYGFMILQGAYGLSHGFRLLREKPVLRRIAAGLLSLCVLLTGVGVVTQHPYQFAYYQPLIQLCYDDNAFELDYWNLSVMNILTKLAQQCSAPIRIGYGDLWACAGLKRTLPSMEPQLKERFILVEEANQADYVLVNPTYACFSHYSPLDGARELITLYSYSRPIMHIYENPTRTNEREEWT